MNTQLTFADEQATYTPPKIMSLADQLADVYGRGYRVRLVR